MMNISLLIVITSSVPPCQAEVSVKKCAFTEQQVPLQLAICSFLLLLLLLL